MNDRTDDRSCKRALKLDMLDEEKCCDEHWWRLETGGLGSTSFVLSRCGSGYGSTTLQEVEQVQCLGL